MINLNSSEYDVKVVPTPELILKYVNDLSIFNYYIKNLEINTAFSSPLRKDESPSFSVFYSEKFNKFLFKDLATGECGDCFIFLKKLFPAYKFSEILETLCDIFNLSDHFYCPNISQFKNPRNAKIIENIDDYKKTAKIINIKIKVDSDKQIKWEYYDIMFWHDYGISLTTLKLFNVVPITHIFIHDPEKNKDTIMACDKYAYAFVETKDDKTTYKIYQPYSTLKWLSSHNHTVHQGYKQLPDKGDLLIITKSLKDVMSLYEVTKIPSIGIQSETIIIKDTVIKEYKERFKEVFCLFDNDKVGTTLSEKYNKLYNLPSILIPKDYGSKDFSDLVKSGGKEVAKLLLNFLIDKQLKVY